jgi:hypothetical protein
MADLDPFKRSADRRFSAGIEFSVFRDQALDLINESIIKLARFQSLENMFSFFVTTPSKETIQAEFGRRSMFRRTPDGNLAIEKGATLLYSLGGTGDIAISLYPCKSNIANTTEDHIYLYIGKLTAYQLQKRVPSDVADLVAYVYVSSPDSTPTLREKTRIWLLRKTRSMQIDGKFTNPAASSYLYKGVEFASKSFLSAAFMSILKPIGLGVAILILGYFGFSKFGYLLQAK